MLKQILITGGTTFVSKYTAEYFAAKGHDVTVLNRGSRPQVSGVTHIDCDRTQLGNLLLGKRFVGSRFDNVVIETVCRFFAQELVRIFIDIALADIIIREVGTHEVIRLGALAADAAGFL